jgi:hypothetical protein
VHLLAVVFPLENSCKKGSRMGTAQLVTLAWPWLQWALGAFGIGALVSVLIYIATGRDGDIVVWYSHVAPIYPSWRTKNQALPLSLLSKEVNSLFFINVQVSNAGKKEPIGSQDKQWTFQITGPPEAILSTIGEPIPCSKRLVLSPSYRSEGNRVALQVGLFQPRDFFDLRFIVANADALPSSLRVDMGNTLEGLPEPIVTTLSPWDRAIKRLFGPLFIVYYVGFMAVAITEEYFPNLMPNWMPHNLTGSYLPIWGKALVGLLFAGTPAILLSGLIGLIAVELWQRGILRAA